MPAKKRFTVAFKRRVVEELLSQTCSMEHLSHSYDISPALILRWRKRYEEGNLVEGPSETEKTLRARNAELEQLVSWLTMENEMLKKALESALQGRRESYSMTVKSSATSEAQDK